jgi:hypothetical protein
MSGALAGQTVVLIGGSAGIGARRTAAFDATDPDALREFFAGLEGMVDHVMVTAG